MIIAALIRFSLTFSFSFYILLITGLYPTTIRSTAFGFIVSFGMMGSILSPYAVDLANKIHLNPTILFSILGFFCLIQSPFIGEIKNI